MQKSETQQKRETLFIVYMAFLLGITVFRPWAVSWEHFFQGSLNLKPFAEYVRLLEKGHLVRALYLFLGNIAVFIPFGMYLAYRKPEWKWGRIVLYGFFLSMVIECMQYVLGTGYTELDDLVLNTAGVGVGVNLNKWNKVKFIQYVCIGVLVFSTLYMSVFAQEPSVDDAVADAQEERYGWFVPIDCKSFDGRYLAKQEYPESEKPARSIRVDIYDTETDTFVDCIYAESLWCGFLGIAWGRDNYDLTIGLMDGTMLHYEYADGGWHETGSGAEAATEGKEE